MQREGYKGVWSMLDKNKNIITLKEAEVGFCVLPAKLPSPGWKRLYIDLFLRVYALSLMDNLIGLYF